MKSVAESMLEAFERRDYKLQALRLLFPDAATVSQHPSPMSENILSNLQLRDSCLFGTPLNYDSGQATDSIQNA